MHYRIKDFKTILSEDFREFGTSGKVYDKTIQLSFVNDEGISEIPFIITNFHVELLSHNIAHVTYQTESKSDGSNAKWCLYFHQGTRTI